MFSEPRQISVLSAAHCEDWALRVLMNESHWRRRHCQAPFFTLGMAAYLDAVCPRGNYHDRDGRRQSNRFLYSRFQDLYRVLEQSIEAQLQRPVMLVETQAALPGFHVYLPHQGFTGRAASVHYDRQYQHIFVRDIDDPEAHFSFTLALSNPAGSGIRLWDKSETQPCFYPYAEGQLFLHDGHSLHQAVLNCTEDCERITLQGHGVEVNGKVWLYW